MKEKIFDLQVGSVIKRSELHDEYGGSRQSGIASSQKTPNIFIFTHPEEGETHGYYDRWEDNGRILHYSGEGQNGDQTMTRGNKAILEHQQTGRALRVFVQADEPSHVRYVGEFTIQNDSPYSECTQHSTNNGPERKVFEFHLVKKETQ